MELSTHPMLKNEMMATPSMGMDAPVGDWLSPLPELLLPNLVYSASVGMDSEKQAKTEMMVSQPMAKPVTQAEISLMAGSECNLMSQVSIMGEF